MSVRFHSYRYNDGFFEDQLLISFGNGEQKMENTTPIIHEKTVKITTNKNVLKTKKLPSIRNLLIFQEFPQTPRRQICTNPTILRFVKCRTLAIFKEWIILLSLYFCVLVQDRLRLWSEDNVSWRRNTKNMLKSIWGWLVNMRVLLASVRLSWLIRHLENNQKS